MDSSHTQLLGLIPRYIVLKLTKGSAPDTSQMNAKICEMIKEVLKSGGVEEIFKLGDQNQKKIDIFAEDYPTQKLNYCNSCC